MPDLSRTQLLVYAAVAVAVLLTGARFVRSGQDEGGTQGTSFAAEGFEPGADTTRDVVVHVAGAVARPGVYRLPTGARVADAVKRAGGLAPGAAQDGINLAARLSDGQQIVVPGPGGPAGGTGEDGPVSLGSASAEDLDEIEGIGPVTAEKIIEFRDEKGGLSSVDQLDEISGVGPSTMEALRSGLQP